MVTQSSDSNKVHILYINKSTDLQTPVTVEVENGIYQVTIFAIRNNVGILDSHVLHVEEVNVGTTPNTLGKYLTSCHNNYEVFLLFRYCCGDCRGDCCGDCCGVSCGDSCGDCDVEEIQDAKEV